jgi:hypothetical protein
MITLLEQSYTTLNELLIRLKSELTTDFIKIDEIEVNAKLPISYSDFPTTNLPFIEGFTVYSLDKVVEYFNCIINDQVRIHGINNMDLDKSTFSCDYCLSFINYKLYTCQECNKMMCPLCFSETSEEIALKNGAKNYQSRKDELNKCQQNHKLTETYPTENVVCDNCNEKPKESEYFSNVTRDYGDRSDLCLICSQTNEGKELIKDNNLTKRTNYLSNVWTEFGSLFDWIPIYSEDETDALIRKNLNSRSNNFGKFCLSCVDDHGRQGYNVTNLSLDIIVSKLNNFITQFKSQFKTTENSWDKHYNSPLHTLMNELGFRLYYG